MKQSADQNMRNPIVVIFIWLLRVVTIILIVMIGGTAISKLDIDGWIKYGYFVNLIALVLPIAIIYSIFLSIKKLNQKDILVFDKILFISFIVVYMIWGIRVFV